MSGRSRNATVLLVLLSISCIALTAGCDRSPKNAHRKKSSLDHVIRDFTKALQLKPDFAGAY